jgi:hypothetical protein
MVSSAPQTNGLQFTMLMAFSVCMYALLRELRLLAPNFRKF